jgi:uncharacterized protein (TIGR01777 family)
MRVFVVGATGLIGVPLVERLRQRGDAPVVLTRTREKAAARWSGVEIVEGDPQEYGSWTAAVDGCQAVVNLVGEPVFGKRWSEQQKRVLRDSRVVSTQNIVRAIEAASSRPGVLANASAIGYYGDVPEGELTEKSVPGNDFLARLCMEWEAAAQEAHRLDVRVALVRTGVVLARQGGALKQMLLPFKLGLGGPVGNGKQWVSWIHLDDIVGTYLTALDHSEASGPINGTAPEPLRNKAFSKCLAAALHRPCIFPIPGFALRLRFGEVADVIIGGQRVLPLRLEQLGYKFQHPTCAAAMSALFPK